MHTETESLSDFHRRLADNRIRQIASELDPKLREQKQAVHTMCGDMDAGAAILATANFTHNQKLSERA